MAKVERSSSSLILAFTQARQEYELKNTAQHDIEHTIHERRSNLREINPKQKVVPSKSSKSTSSKDLKNAISNAERYKSMDEHKIALTDLISRLETNLEKGLSAQKAYEQNQNLGDNILSARKKTPWYILLLKEFFGSFSLLLWLGAVLCWLSYGLAPADPSNLYLGLALAIVVVFTGLQTFYQNQKSDSIMESFKNFIPPKCNVFRDGNLINIPASKLVPGDIVEVKSGDRIPADIRITFCQEMKVDNSSLTGESEPLLRTVKCTDEKNPLETANLAFFGTLCREGMGRGVVINIGDQTIIGQIANLASSATQEESTLSREMTRFVKIIASIAILTGSFFFGMGFALGYPPVTNLSFGVGVLTAYVPEGLVTCCVIGLSLTALRLSKKKVLVKNLSSVETLGSTTCICSDKTGTLTQNRMTVEHLWYDGNIIKGTNYEKLKSANRKPEYDPESEGFETLHHNVILSSDAVFNQATPMDRFDVLKSISNPAQVEKKRKEIEEQYLKELSTLPWLEKPVIGDASESALVRFFQPIEDIKTTRSKFPIKKMKDGSEGKIPFNSQWKYALSIVDDKTENSDVCILIKGAPERIWGLCNCIMINGEPVSIDSEWQAKFNEVNRSFGEGGERVLGFAKLNLPRDEYPGDYQFDCKNPMEPNYPMKNFIFTGLISMIDPPRDAVPYAILKCKTAGIKVIMVTGDQAVTAAAIARQVNIFNKTEKTVNQIAEEQNISFDEAFEKSDAIVIHGDMITEAVKKDELLPEKERGKTLLRWLEKPRVVFARTTPAQKLIIVKACQSQGHIVAVTGDGVNDSPAIKKADIGIAMGITGSDVAKDSAAMVLLSDDFSAIVIGVEEGRKIFDNIKRSIVYILAEDITELIPFLTLIILGFPLPLSTILILCVDLGFNIIPSISWSGEEAEIDIMVRPPRRKHDHLVTTRLLTSAFAIYGVIQSIGTFLTYVVVMRDFGARPGDLYNLGVANGVYPNPGDVYDSSAPFYGQTSQKFIDYCSACWAGTQDCDPNSLDPDSVVDPAPDWLYSKDMTVDLRLFFLNCKVGGGFEGKFEWNECHVKQLSVTSGAPVCFTTEMLKNAQTALYISIMISQLHSSFIVKTRSQSFAYSGLRNYQMFFGWAWMIMFGLVISYLQPINIAFNSRQLIFLHFGWPCFPFLVLFICYDELRKYLMRNIPNAKGKKPNWIRRNTYW